MCPLGKPSQWQTPLQTFTRVHRESILIKAIILSESEQQRGLTFSCSLPWLGPFSALESDDKNELLEFWIMTRGARRCHVSGSSSMATCIYRGTLFVGSHQSVCSLSVCPARLKNVFDDLLTMWMNEVHNNSLMTNCFFLMNRRLIYRLCLQWAERNVWSIIAPTWKQSMIKCAETMSLIYNRLVKQLNFSSEQFKDTCGPL